MYNALLLASMVSVGAGLLAWFVRKPQFSGPTRILALILALTALGTHWRGGHGADTPEPMSFGLLLQNHPAPALVAVLAAGLIAVTRGRRPR